jgi:hypothetical protein
MSWKNDQFKKRLTKNTELIVWGEGGIESYVRNYTLS